MGAQSCGLDQGRICFDFGPALRVRITLTPVLHRRRLRNPSAGPCTGCASYQPTSKGEPRSSETPYVDPQSARHSNPNFISVS